MCVCVCVCVCMCVYVCVLVMCENIALHKYSTCQKIDVLRNRSRLIANLYKPHI